MKLESNITNIKDLALRGRNQSKGLALSVPLLLCPFAPTVSINYNIFPDTLFMQNKPKVKYAKMNINTFITMRYAKMDIWLFRKNKANQTQPVVSLSNLLKPALSAVEWAKTKPIQTQLLQRPKMMQSIYKQRITKKIRLWAIKKQSQSNPICYPSSAAKGCISGVARTFTPMTFARIEQLKISNKNKKKKLTKWAGAESPNALSSSSKNCL